jgi:phosphatidylglycerophosphatase C
MKERIAFFDFDGTITTRDTMLEFIKYYSGSLKFYAGFLITSPLIVAYKIGLIKKIIAKEKFLGFFFKGESLSQFESRCKAFSKEVLPSLIRPKAFKEIQQLKSAGVKVVIVSASAENWIRDWATENGVELMGTRLAVKDDKISGSFHGENCYGNEKVCRIKERYDLSNYNEIFCYGDTSGDKPMLQLATHSFYKPFR